MVNPRLVNLSYKKYDVHFIYQSAICAEVFGAAIIGTPLMPWSYKVSFSSAVLLAHWNRICLRTLAMFSWNVPIEFTSAYSNSI